MKWLFWPKSIDYIGRSQMSQKEFIERLGKGHNLEGFDDPPGLVGYRLHLLSHLDEYFELERGRHRRFWLFQRERKIPISGIVDRDSDGRALVRVSVGGYLWGTLDFSYPAVLGTLIVILPERSPIWVPLLVGLVGTVIGYVVFSWNYNEARRTIEVGLEKQLGLQLERLEGLDPNRPSS